MQLVQETPDFNYVLRGVSAAGVLVNQRTLDASFILTPQQLITDWRPRGVDELLPEDLDPALALQPEVILLGTGSGQRFASARVMAHVLARGIGLEAMTNAAAARTFTVLASESRRVLVAFLLPG